MAKIKHGMCDSKMYIVWQNMRARCNNKNNHRYNNYGGRGIMVCEKWQKSFLGFYKDMKEGYSESLSLDRINVNGNYKKSNCKWSTDIEQASNRQNTVYLTIGGETKLIRDWCKISGVGYNTVKQRINSYKWDIEEAVFTLPLIFDKIILDSETGIFYDSLTDATKFHNYSISSLSEMLSGKRVNKTNLMYI